MLPLPLTMQMTSTRWSRSPQQPVARRPSWGGQHRLKLYTHFTLLERMFIKRKQCQIMARECVFGSLLAAVRWAAGQFN